MLENSALPGPRANLELLAAASEWIELGEAPLLGALSPTEAPGNDPAVLLAGIGVVALARSALRGDPLPWDVWRGLAADPRWRIRETVAMALQRVGDGDWEMLKRETARWMADGPWQWRAVVTGLCEPRLLTAESRALYALGVLDEVTRRLTCLADRKSEAVRVLRKGLGYAWSVAIVSCPEAGRRMLERWADSADRDVLWMVRENLSNSRLARLDAAWVSGLREGMATRGLS